MGMAGCLAAAHPAVQVLLLTSARDQGGSFRPGTYATTSMGPAAHCRQLRLSATSQDQHHPSTAYLLVWHITVYLQDGTLVTCKSGQEFPGTADDYRFFNPSVVETVQQYQEDGYRVVVFR